MGSAYALPTEPNNSTFFLDGVLDGLGARRKQLARIKALALLVLSGLDVFTGGLGEGELAFGVHIDLGNTQADGPFLIISSGMPVPPCSTRGM